MCDSYDQLVLELSLYLGRKKHESIQNRSTATKNSVLSAFNHHTGEIECLNDVHLFLRDFVENETKLSAPKQ